MEQITEADLSMLYDHKTPAQLSTLRTLSEILLKNITKDCSCLHTAHYSNVREELIQRCHARIAYITNRLQSMAQPPIPTPKPKQPINQ